jgi:hypothetical protein
MTTWDELETALLDVLADLPDRARLIVKWRERDRYYVQAAADSGRPMAVEAVADSGLPPELRLGEDGADRLTALGWVPPESERDNWSIAIAWPGRTADYAHGAHLAVASLRDVFGVPGPDDLVYTAWRDGEQPPADRSYDLDDLEPGDDDLAFPALGLTRVPPA